MLPQLRRFEGYGAASEKALTTPAAIDSTPRVMVVPEPEEAEAEAEVGPSRSRSRSRGASASARPRRRRLPPAPDGPRRGRRGRLTPRYRGAIRSAPSSRIVSPLSIGFSTIDVASCAYSPGRPSRCGNGIELPSASRASSGSAREQRGVEQARGDRHDADAVLGEVARGRERHADDAALRGRVGDLADLALVRGDRRGLHAHAALGAVVGLVPAHRRRRRGAGR